MMKKDFFKLSTHIDVFVFIGVTLTMMFLLRLIPHWYLGYRRNFHSTDWICHLQQYSFFPES
ncbi:hypothetical protein CLV44_1346 [Marinobacterium halophilum]|uniref:Uncharacterized protein n=1 Tax=Marinobacterium halophilum TaxID=267374 RepID=A0A2P8EIA4_9GAMM|nr:hypothetical protein CLV44_1346 [Marinobacterium halophilum]